MGNGPSTRKVVRISLAVAGTAGALYLLYLIRSVLELILLAVFVALWLGTFVEFLTRRRVPRVVAILAAYLALFASVLFLGFVAVPPIVRQIDAGVRQLPGGIGKLRENATFRKYDNGGVIGALLAIPVAAAIQIVVRDVWQQRHDGVSEAGAQPAV